MNKYLRLDKNYEGAINLLNSRRRTKRPEPREPGSRVAASMPSLNGAPTLRGTPSLTGVREWLHKLGHDDNDVNDLNVIHVAGTKGKGSLYTSPHLRYVEERLQINSRPISKDAFAKYVFEVWDGLSLSRDSPQAPRFLQLLMLVSVHTFINEGVNVAIYETHHGGEFDATNIFQKPVVTGITTIGMDHIEQLGPSIENIAWHKSGIFKYGRPAFSSIQEPSAAAVLERRAAEKDVALRFTHVNSSLPAASRVLDVEAQKVNASLALALVDAFLKEKAPKEHQNMTLQAVEQGVEDFSWPGRFQQIIDGKYQWFLDGAHNDLSLQKAAQWFAKSASRTQSTTPLTRILIFSQLSERDGAALLKFLAGSLRASVCQIQHVILSTYEERQDGTVRIDHCLKPPQKRLPNVQKDYIQAWNDIDPRTTIHAELTIEGALQLAKKIGDQSNGMQTLITGSLYLVGGALLFLEPEDPAMP